jgi:sporulation protein YlmC with PRC-barrel domain
MADHNARRGIHDEAGVGPDPREALSLTPLKKLGDHKVAAGEPDIRGWTVFIATGRELGEVEDLLVDTRTNEVVMIDVDLKRDDRHTLAPIRAAWIDREHKRVVINSQYLVNDEDIPALRRTQRALRSDERLVAATETPGSTSSSSGEPTAPGELEEEARRFNERYDRAYGERGDAIKVLGEGDDLRLERPGPLAGPTTEALTPRPVGDREVRFPHRPVDMRDDAVIIEERILRRRLVDPAELDADELDRLRRENIREGVDRMPPTEERR